jgi:hypothetical protein
MKPITAYSRREQRIKAWLVPSRAEALANSEDTWGRTLNPFEGWVLGGLPMLWEQAPLAAEAERANLN